VSGRLHPLATVALASLVFAGTVGGGIFALAGDPVAIAAPATAARLGTPEPSAPALATLPAAAQPVSPAPTASSEPTAAPSRDLAAGVAPRIRQREGAMIRATPTPPPTPTPRPITTTPTPAATPAPAPGGGTAAGPNYRVATRVVVPALGIDLPVMPQRTSYPACNVAMYLTELSQPGQGGPTYLYAHARAGMFLALLTQSQISNGANMIGMRVDVYTGDDRVFTYQIDEVRRHTTDLAAVLARGNESLWLQTSEGPRGTIPKLQVGAHLVSSGSASHAASHPVPRPVAC
jgi:hypothetical protein